MRNNEGGKGESAKKKGGSEYSTGRDFMEIEGTPEIFLKPPTYLQGRGLHNGRSPGMWVEESGILRGIGDDSKPLKKESIPTHGKVAEKKDWREQVDWSEL